jgi:hypothetical protein
MKQYRTVCWISPSETLVPTYESTQRDIPEDRICSKCFFFHVVVQKYQDTVFNNS